MKKTVLVIALTLIATTVAAQAALTTRGTDANYGTHSYQAGFTPDPAEITITSGGSINAASANSGCNGFVTANPDAIIRWRGQSEFLRLAFRPNEAGQDTTLVVRTPGGQYICNDDTVGLNPVVDLNNPAAGAYRVWVGSYEAGTNTPGKLLVSELRSTTP